MSYREPWKDEPTAKWEPVADDLRRIKVPGGWLYRTSLLTAAGAAVALLFVPDRTTP